MAVKLVAVNVVVMFAMLMPAVAKLSSDDSQRVMAPVCPLNAKVVELVPVQTVALPATVPPTVVGETVAVTSNRAVLSPVSYTHLTLPTNREV